MKDQPADFRANERQQQVKRLHVYHFRYDTTHFYFANYDLDVNVIGGPVEKMSDPQIFTAAQIAHTNPDETTDSAPAAVNVMLSALDAELRKYFITVSPREIEVEIWRVSSAALPGDLDYDDDMRMVFRGIVESITFNDVTITATCITHLMQENRTIPSYFYQKLCNHTLYSDLPGCGVDKALFNVSISLSALNRPSSYVDITSTSINVGSPSRSVTITNETFVGGYVEDSLGNKMGIQACEVLPAAAGTRLWLSWMPRTLTSGNTVTVYCGCLYIKRTCHDLFNNLPQFGGTPYVPVNNPAMDGVKV